MDKKLRDEALEYHRAEPRGKLGIHATKRMQTSHDLSMAYSPGVAAACEEIKDNPLNSLEYTSRGNLVAVISNGTAVLGLGAIGALASKPVMEGKAVLFKNFSGIDVFDLEIEERDPDKFIEIVKAIAPTFGGINLEDIKAPECFIIEKALKEQLDIPVFHDDQHGTAICVAAAVRNGLRVANKNIEEVKLVCSGAGAAALACLNLLVSMGINKHNITVCDIVGVVYEGREEQMDPYKSRYAQTTDARKLSDVIQDADIFLGLSAPDVLKAEDVKRMARDPLILALANPTPEILPEVAHQARPDVIMATGRSDYPNQVNNVLCFPFLFRGALDVGASTINEPMKFACVEAIADLAMAETSETVADAYVGESLKFGRDYLIPKPFDPRLLHVIPPKVAIAAMESGVAKQPIQHLHGYQTKLQSFAIKTYTIMRPVFELAREHKQRIVFAEGESIRIHRAVQTLCDEGICYPLLIGRREQILAEMQGQAMRLEIDRDFDVIEPGEFDGFDDYCSKYHALMQRKGVTPGEAKSILLRDNTALASMLLQTQYADGLICGLYGHFEDHMAHLRHIIGLAEDLSDFSTVNLLLHRKGPVFFTDTQVTQTPDPKHLAETVLLCAKVVARFGLEPKVALLSNSNFGKTACDSSTRMQETLDLLREQAPDLLVDGEMQSSLAINAKTREFMFPNMAYKGSANLFVMPSLDAANIAHGIVRELGDAVDIGPILLGANKAAHILTTAVSVRGIINMAAVAAADAIEEKLQKNNRLGSKN